MSRHKAFSLFLRMGAVAGAFAILVSQAPPARSAVPAPLFQAAMPPIPVPNLRGYWPMDAATAGVTPDMSGIMPSSNGTVQPGATIDVANKATVPAGNPASLAVSGAADQCVIVPDSTAISLTGSITVAAWIRPTIAAAASGPQHGIIEKFDYTTGPLNGYYMRLSPQNYLSWTVAGPASSIGISSSPRVVNTNVWTHVAATYNSGNGAMVMYIGGNADATTGTFAGGPPGDGAAELRIGGSYSAHYLGGHVDEARVYNRVLTPTEIQILRDGQPAPAMGIPAAFAGMVQLSWTPPSTAPAGMTYSLLRGSSAGNYNLPPVHGIPSTQTTYDDMAAPPSVPTYYSVVAVSVMASALSNEVSQIPGPAGPPPPPPPPRTSQVGGEDNPCGCGSVSPAAGWVAATLGLLLLLASLRRG